MDNSYRIEIISENGLHELEPILLASPISLKIKPSQEIGQYLLEQDTLVNGVNFIFEKLVGSTYSYNLFGPGITNSLIEEFSEFLKILDFPHRALNRNTKDSIFISFLWKEESTERTEPKVIENDYCHFLDKFDEFKYPESYIALQNKDCCLNDTNWRFIYGSKGLADVCLNLLNEDLKSKKLLIPFARGEYPNSPLANFDKDGRVYLYVGEKSLKDIDWEKRFYYNNFNDWLENILNEKL